MDKLIVVFIFFLSLFCGAAERTKEEWIAANKASVEADPKYEMKAATTFFGNGVMHRCTNNNNVTDPFEIFFLFGRMEP